MPLSRLASLAAVLGLIVACSDALNPIDGKSCTLAACNNGVRIDFTYREAGTYAVDVTIDGVKNTCTATLPLPAAPPPQDECTAAGIYLAQSGSALPASQQSIGGLQIQSTTAQNVAIKVASGGAVLAEKSFAVQYVVSPGPNGPDCDPKECRAVTYTLP